MSFVNLCHAVPGKLNRKKLSINLNSKVDNVRKEAAELVGKPKEEILILYQSKTLKDGSVLSACGIKSGGLLMIIHKLPPVKPAAPTPVKISDEEVKRFQVAFGSAIRNPSFRRVVKRLLQRDNIETLAAACPGLAEDLSAQAFLTRPELLIHLLDPDTLKRVGEAHPSLCEAANNLAAAVHEEQVSSGTHSQQQESGSYFLDEMSDEEMEEDDSAGGVQRARSFSAITPEQLTAALAAATGAPGGGSPFLGVTGMGPASRSGAATTPNTRPTSAATTPGARITTDMFQAAMQQALGGATGAMALGGSTGAMQQALGGALGFASPQSGAPPQPMQQGEAGGEDMAGQVARMREMGIADEGLAVRALQVMGGDLQAAVDLILSGWLGDDDSAN